MLRVSVHAGLLPERKPENVMATVDIAYQKRAALADYLIAVSHRQAGECPPAVLANYPRWSASLWDLTARAMARSLYGDTKVPPTVAPDRRCAYATRLCAVIERHTVDERSVLLGQAELWQQGPSRGTYTVTLEEDIMGSRQATFDYGAKRLNVLDLVFRGLCWALFSQDTPGPRPKLILPTSITVGDEDRFDVASLAEPARTGFARFLAATQPNVAATDWAAAKDYVRFLMEA